jgi:hypothetical protein
MTSSAPKDVWFRYRAQYRSPTKTVQEIIINEAVAMRVGPVSSAKNPGVMASGGSVKDMLNDMVY